MAAPAPKSRGQWQSIKLSVLHTVLMWPGTVEAVAKKAGLPLWKVKLALTSLQAANDITVTKDVWHAVQPGARRA